MILKLLFIAVLIYFVLKTTARLIHAMREEPDPSRPDRRTPDWHSRRNGSSSRRSYEEEDVEDAKFMDV